MKANQENFYNNLILYFNKDTIDKIRIGKSKIITYEYFQTKDIKWYHKKED